MTLAISAMDVGDARQRLAGNARVTPVAISGRMNRRAGTEIYMKCENLQRMGAFKFRGAFNTLSRDVEGFRRSGVLTYSSGNHAQAIAKAGALLGIETTIIMPADAPPVKLAACREYGGNVITYDRATASREDLAHEVLGDRDLTLVPPFDHPDVIAGQGTAAAELFDQVGELDALFVPCGGGGLLSGSAIAARSTNPKCRIYGVEPETADDARQSFTSGQLVSIQSPQTIADGVRTTCLGDLTFPIIRELVDDMITVSDAEIAASVRDLFTYSKMVVEPSGAIGLAAVMSGRIPEYDRVGVILSGGNIDHAIMARILGGEL